MHQIISHVCQILRENFALELVAQDRSEGRGNVHHVYENAIAVGNAERLTSVFAFESGQKRTNARKSTARANVRCTNTTLTPQPRNEEFHEDRARVIG